MTNIRIHIMTRRDRIASGPGGGAGTSGGGWEGKSISGRMEERGGGRKDGFGGPEERIERLLPEGSLSERRGRDGALTFVGASLGGCRCRGKTRRLKSALRWKAGTYRCVTGKPLVRAVTTALWALSISSVLSVLSGAR